MYLVGFIIRIWTENKTCELQTEGQLMFGYMENIFTNNIN